jgi:hypothetical protein
VRLDESTWPVIGEVDPDLANRTRERRWRELEGETSLGWVRTSQISSSDACSRQREALVEVILRLTDGLTRSFHSISRALMVASCVERRS